MEIVKLWVAIASIPWDEFLQEEIATAKDRMKKAGIVAFLGGCHHKRRKRLVKYSL